MKDIINKIGTKNIIKMGMVVIIIIVCIIGFSLIYYNFFYQKSYEEIESIMIDAAKHYYSDHEEELPKTVGESKSIKAETLTSNDYMKSISEYLKNEDIACKASINVTNVNNKLTLIYNDERIDNIVWDDRYNNEKMKNLGINDYKVSRIKEHLNNLYKGSTLFKISDKLLITNYSLEIGKAGEEDDDRSGNLAKSNILDNQYIGLISAKDFMIASLDKNCTKVSSESCANYNYLAKYDYNYWTLTADKDSTNKVFEDRAYRVAIGMSL